MPAACVLTLDNMRGVRKSMLVEPITTLSDERLLEVCATACRD